ncbi:MAG: hypothetical protein DMG85_13560 [Acidobacteria bacterium]|nr:MAG: hypothetical protein DMG85_13560 [Acidobacteriota bacterium]
MSRGLLVSLEILDHGSDQLADLGREPDRAKSPFPHASTDMAAAEGVNQKSWLNSMTVAFQTFTFLNYR